LCVFTRAAQARRIGWPILIFLLRFGIFAGLWQNHFPISAHDFLAANLHRLYANDLVAHDADEIDVLGRLALDPLHVVGIAILLPHLFWRSTLGVQHHLGIHSD